MQNITYLDNAATTAVDPAVVDAMIPYLTGYFGNPSSNYSIGRLTKTAIESARKNVAGLLGVKATSIYFTSGGTESNNTAIATAVTAMGCKHMITSPIEHHAVLNTVAYHCRQNGVTSSYVALGEYGKVDLQDLERQLKEKAAQGIKCLVSLMHANNEIGTLLDLKSVGELCKTYGAIFHSDGVQTIGHYPVNLSDYHLHFASASGHKFHGPKGTGILYVAEGTKATPLIHGGGQERRLRAGTENVHGIVGFAKALELAMDTFATDQPYIQSLNRRLRAGLLKHSPAFTFNNAEDGLYTVLSVNFPEGIHPDFLLSYLDQAGICVSGGSACSSGDDLGSHVIQAIGKKGSGATVRFSFSKLTTEKDIDFALETIGRFLQSHYKR
ncbi:aminotransferase class V-fold PLP-dependent enzyme [Pedobacter petrophilus]|uniref:cysteine desulfurase n=1 Tax=Pedobacter petrophilus TaxID=1908241 RepID=A0A7K0FXD0_9SPHI|nr:cysteine desulfurase family protein [Pedobacter petrophilus]MRX76273.1 aminotransferase class V-fold PLP-dependent enzyme [Pedobacter petrophilus]